MSDTKTFFTFLSLAVLFCLIFKAIDEKTENPPVKLMVFSACCSLLAIFYPI